MQSGDDVGNDAVGDQLDLILQRQLFFLHPRKLELVAIAGRSEQLDFLVEAVMVGLEEHEDFSGFVVIYVVVLQESRFAVTIAEPRSERAIPFKLLATNRSFRD